MILFSFCDWGGRTVDGSATRSRSAAERPVEETILQFKGRSPSDHPRPLLRPLFRGRPGMAFVSHSGSEVVPQPAPHVLKASAGSATTGFPRAAEIARRPILTGIRG